MKHTYEDYFNAAKEIFQSDALKEYQGYFELNGQIIFGPRCGYTTYSMIKNISLFHTN